MLGAFLFQNILAKKILPGIPHKQENRFSEKLQACSKYLPLRNHLMLRRVPHSMQINHAILRTNHFKSFEQYTQPKQRTIVLQNHHSQKRTCFETRNIKFHCLNSSRRQKSKHHRKPLHLLDVHNRIRRILKQYFWNMALRYRLLNSKMPLPLILNTEQENNGTYHQYLPRRDRPKNPSHGSPSLEKLATW